MNQAKDNSRLDELKRRLAELEQILQGILAEGAEVPADLAQEHDELKKQIAQAERG